MEDPAFDGERGDGQINDRSVSKIVPPTSSPSSASPAGDRPARADDAQGHAVRRRAPRTRRKEARPGELLAAALDLFVEKGYAATRVEAVAARAGVSKGTLFLYFPTKEALFKAVVRENLASRLSEGAARVAAFDGSAVDLLHRILQDWWTNFGATKLSGIGKLMMAEAANFPELARFYVDEVVRPAQAMFAGVIRRGIARGEFRPVNVDDAVHTVMAPMMLLVLWQRSIARRDDPSPAIEPARFLAQHVEIVARGLLVEVNR